MLIQICICLCQHPSGFQFFHLERHWTKIQLRLPVHLSLFYSLDVLAAFPRLELAATNTAIKLFLVSSPCFELVPFRFISSSLGFNGYTRYPFSSKKLIRSPWVLFCKNVTLAPRARNCSARVRHLMVCPLPEAREASERKTMFNLFILLKIQLKNRFQESALLRFSITQFWSSAVKP